MRLPVAEWTMFTACPNEEVGECVEYESARELPRFIQTVKEFRSYYAKWNEISDSQLLVGHPHFKSLRGWSHVIRNVFFPEKPWLSIPKRKKYYLLHNRLHRALYGRKDLEPSLHKHFFEGKPASMIRWSYHPLQGDVFSLLELQKPKEMAMVDFIGAGKFNPIAVRHLSDSEAITHACFGIDWKKTNEELLRLFESWLMIKRPPQCEAKEKRGARSPREVLKWIGAFRIDRQCKGNPAARNQYKIKDDAGVLRPLYESEKGWIGALKKYREHINKLEL
jgi:hypothetical protein